MNLMYDQAMEFDVSFFPTPSGKTGGVTRLVWNCQIRSGIWNTEFWLNFSDRERGIWNKILEKCSGIGNSEFPKPEFWAILMITGSKDLESETPINL